MNDTQSHCLDFWKQFLSKTDNLCHSHVSPMSSLKDLFSEQDVIDVLNTISNNHSPGFDYGIRVFIDNKQRTDSEIQIINNPPRNAVSIKHWLKEIFSEQPFGIVINLAERWSDRLCQKITYFIDPLYKVIGVKNEIELVIFIGNYGYTPFGVHYDGDIISNIHLHLGPGEKNMYLWKPQKFKELTGSYNFYHRPEEIIHTASKFVIPANHVYLLPSGYFHVGYTRDFSIGIALCFRKYRTNNFIVRAIKEKLENDLNSKPTRNFDINKFDFKSILESLEQHDCAKTSFLKDSLEEMLLIEKSKNYFSNKPFLKSISPDEFKNKNIKKIDGFTVYMKEKANKLSVFVRGNRIIVKNISDIKKIIEDLNSGALIPVTKLIRVVTTIAEDDLYKFISILYAYGGIEIL